MAKKKEKPEETEKGVLYLQGNRTEMDWHCIMKALEKGYTVYSQYGTVNPDPTPPPPNPNP